MTKELNFNIDDIRKENEDFYRWQEEMEKRGKHGNQRHHINWNISAKKGLLAHLCRLYLLKGETNE